MINKVLDKLLYFVDKHKCLTIFLLSFPHIFHIECPYISMALINYSITRLRLLSFIIVMLLFIINNKKPSKLLICSFIYSLIILFSTVLNNISNINKALLFVSSFLSLALIVELYINDIKVLISSLLISFEIQLYPNLLTVFLFRDVIDELSANQTYNYNYFFLGTANDLILYLLPAFFLSILYIKIIKKSLRPILLILVSILTVFLSYSNTTEISFIVFIMTFAYLNIIRKDSAKYPLLIILIPIIIFIIVVVPYVFVGKNMLIDYVLEKIYYNHSFECRTFIWKDAKKYLLSQPLFGYGYYNDVFVMYGNENDIYSIAHNGVIQIMLNYGIIGLLSIIGYFIVLIKKVIKYNNSFIKSFFISIICGILITFITQDYHRFFELQIIFSIMYSFDKQKSTINMENL